MKKGNKKMKQNGIQVYTVKELKEELDKLISEGNGDKIVLVPCYDEANEGEYRTIGAVENDDITGQCIYLEDLSNEDEATFWGRNDD